MEERIKIAIYSRKSRYTGHGESIANQIEECKRYCGYMLRQTGKILDYTIYEDEGFSGKDFQRPAMKKFLSELEQYDFFICYRLDRVSRSVADFASLIEKLRKANVEFISVSESFDTTKAMGRAMMTISSAFAELERDTITERVVANMTALAKTGRWLGGTTPLGFESKKMETEKEGKVRVFYQLDVISEEIEIVNIIYQKYQELGSLTQLAADLMNQSIVSRKGNDFTNYSLKFILQNPVYCRADERAWDFLKENELDIYADKSQFDGSHGLIAYNKTNEHQRYGKGRFNDWKDWIISIGEHEAVISSECWIDVQRKLRKQSKFAFRRARTNKALLSGLVYCDCGAPMRPKSTGTSKENGEKRFSYLCERKSRSKGGLCRQKNVQGNTLDELVVSYLLERYQKLQEREDEAMIMLQRELEMSFAGESKETLMEHSLQRNQKKRKRLIHSLESAASEEVEQALLSRMEDLSREIESQKKALAEVRSQMGIPNTEKRKKCLNTLLHFDINLWRQLDDSTKKNILELLIDYIEWDGKEATIYPAGVRSYKKKGDEGC